MIYFLSWVPLCPWISCLVFGGGAAVRCCPRSRGREIKTQKIFTLVKWSVAKCESATLESSIRAGLRIYIFSVFYKRIYFFSHTTCSTVKLTEQTRTVVKENGLKVEVRIGKRNGFSWQPGAAAKQQRRTARWRDTTEARCWVEVAEKGAQEPEEPQIQFWLP